jgi:UDP-N-acetylmuramoyl-tripeptide--D-alanyl-D-alanine ligase
VMMMSQVAEALNAELHGQDVLMTGVSKDTRDIQSGDLYVALKGERFDGHQFIAEANAAGAVGVLVSDFQSEIEVKNVPQVQVADTRIALGELASYWRQKFTGKLIGITGSNGKTSVKEMCGKILVDYANTSAVLSTKGNLNNDIGLPMMLLELREQHRYAVIEMGANHVGEIDYLTSIAQPDVALVNNVGPAHLEGFGSLDNIAKTKAEIYNGLSDDGVAIINLDDAFSSFWLDYCSEKNTIGFSMVNDKADIYAELISGSRYQITAGDETAELTLKVPGKHNVMNALAAIAATRALEIPLQSIVSSLSEFENIKGRLTVLTAESGCRVIDDTYNANPLSVSAAIDVLADMQGDVTEKTVLVLGDMAELGESAEQLHVEVGEKAKDAGIAALYATGVLSAHAVIAFGENGYHFQTKEKLIDVLKEDLTGSEVVLVKGSRSAAMEKVVEEILTRDNKNKRVN